MRPDLFFLGKAWLSQGRVPSSLVPDYGRRTQQDRDRAPIIHDARSPDSGSGGAKPGRPRPRANADAPCHSPRKQVHAGRGPGGGSC